MGRLFDSNCAYWRRGCGNTTENCLVYDNRNDRLMILTENYLQFRKNYHLIKISKVFAFFYEITRLF
jgi:hypothetical protein